MSIQSPAKCEIRSVIRYLVWKGKTPVEVYNEVKTVYGDKGMNRTSVFKWCREFKNGRTSVHDDQRSGRPSILTDDIVEKIENALRDDRRLTVDELSAMFPQISRSLLHETITETLGYRKLSARWVPKQLTDQHKLNRVEAGQEFLRRYKLHGDEFLRSIVTGDETWVEKSFQPTRRLEIHIKSADEKSDALKRIKAYLINLSIIIERSNPSKIKRNVIPFLRSLSPSVAMTTVSTGFYSIYNYRITYPLYINYADRIRAITRYGQLVLQINTDLAIFSALQPRFDFSIVLLSRLTTNKLPASGPLTQRSPVRGVRSGGRGQVLKMSIFVPNKVYLRGILLHYFIQKKSAAEAHRILVQTYGDNALSDTTCRDWFRRFKNNDFELEDKERSGALKKFQDKELEQLLDEDPSQTLSELGKILQVDESTVSKRLKGLGMIQKQGHWVPYELRYRLQLMRLSRALKEKRPLYAQRHDKVILLHDNARPHVAKPVKTYLETLKWEVLPHPPYSPDVAPSDFHLFRSMSHGLADRRFHSYEEAQKCIAGFMYCQKDGRKWSLVMGNTLNKMFVFLIF
ncbi:MOS1T transposase, partial [Pseudoatta argentina]